MSKKLLVLLLIVFVCGIALRVARVDREFLGNFGQRQVYNAWVARNFVKEGISLPDSKMDALDPEGKKTPSFRDFPLVIPAVAFLCRSMGGSIEFWGRLLSVLFYAGTFIVLFLWLRSRFRSRTLFFILFFFAFFPISIIYSQSFMLEVSALFFFCLGAFILEEALKKENMWLLIWGSLSVGISFATRMYYGILIVPIIYLFFREWGWGTFKKVRSYLSGFFILLVPVLWQGYAWRTALLTGTKSSLDVTLKTYSIATAGNYYFNPDFWRKIFDDFAGIVFNPLGLSLIVIGLIVWRWKKDNLFFVLYLFSMILAVILVPRKFLRHDYYFFPIIVPGSVLAGYCIDRISEKVSARYFAPVFLAIFLFASFRYSLHPAFKTPIEEKPYLSQTEIVKEVIPQSAKVVVVGARPPFLYYCDRMGWDLSLERPEESHKSTGDVLSGGKLPPDPLQRLKYYEELDAEYVIAYDPSLLGENKELERYVHKNYVPVKNTVYMTIFKKKGR